MSMSKLREKLAAKKKSIQENSGMRADVLRIPMGKHKFRILPAKPAKDSDGQFWADFGLHYIKGEEKDSTSGRNKVKAVYVCVDKTFDKPCDVCAAIEEAARHATTDEQLELVEESKCNRAEVLVNVLHRSSSDKAGIPQILQMTPTTFEKVIDIMDEYPDLVELEGGIDLVITREGTGLNTKYSVMPAAKSANVDASILDEMADLQAFVEQEQEEGLRKAITAINDTVGLLGPVKDRAPAKLIEDKPAAKAKPTAKPKAKSAPKVMEMDDDIMDVMDDDLAVLDEADLDALEGEAVEVKKTGTDDAVVLDGDSDLDDMDELLADLDDL